MTEIFPFRLVNVKIDWYSYLSVLFVLIDWYMTFLHKILFKIIWKTFDTFLYQSHHFFKQFIILISDLVWIVFLNTICFYTRLIIMFHRFFRLSILLICFLINLCWRFSFRLLFLSENFLLVEIRCWLWRKFVLFFFLLSW